MNQRIKKIKTYISNHPKILILILLLATILLLSIVECVRARMYSSSINDYKNSVKVQSLLDTVDKLTKTVNATAPAFYCKLDFQVLSQQYNPATAESDFSQNSVETLIQQIRAEIEIIKPAPAFSSLLEFLPQPKKARNTSEEINGAISRVESLTSSDARSEYCIKMRDALATIYFIYDLQKPEAVSAMSVGQVENFQIKVSDTTNNFISLTFPVVFEKQHLAFLELLNKISADLRQDENNYDTFSRAIEDDVMALNEILQGISDNSGDLANKPTEIAIQLNYLRPSN